MSSATAPEAGQGVAAPAAAPGPAGPRPAPKKVKPLSKRQRPLWMLIPGGVLMTLIIVIPFLIGVWISLTDLDQYTLRRWLSAPFVGLANYVESLSAGLPAAIWISISFAVISTAVTVPIGVAAAIVTQNKYQGPRPDPRDLPHPLRAAVVRGGDGLADDAAAGRHRQQHPQQPGHQLTSSGWPARPPTGR